METDRRRLSNFNFNIHTAQKSETAALKIIWYHLILVKKNLIIASAFKREGGGGGTRERERERETDRQTDRQTDNNSKIIHVFSEINTLFYSTKIVTR